MAVRVVVVSFSPNYSFDKIIREAIEPMSGIGIKGDTHAYADKTVKQLH